MERTILHVAIDSFPIQAERLRCPKLAGRPLALVPSESPRPHVIMPSREACEAGVTRGTPLVLARRLCRDLVALPIDRAYYGGIGESIFGRLAPFAPVVEPAGGPGSGSSESGRFFLDLTGVARTHSEARDRAARAGSDVESSFGLHPTLGVAVNKLVSRVAAQVVAPDGDLVDVSAGSEASFLAPLSVHMLPAARGAEVAPRLDLLSVRFVREVQALSPAHLARAFGKAGLLLWRQARGVDSTPVRAPAFRPRVTAEETLACETNDRRALAAHAARLAAEVGAGLRARGEEARWLMLAVDYADGRGARARRTFARPPLGSAELRAAVAELLGRALTRRVRVRRLRLDARGIARGATQLPLWDVQPEEGPGSRAAALESTIDGARERFGAEALVPAAWMLHGLTIRPSARS